VRKIVALVLAALLSGCVRYNRDLFAIYQADPDAIEIPVITFGAVPF
jgi:hypothetical protein